MRKNKSRKHFFPLFLAVLLSGTAVLAGCGSASNSSTAVSPEPSAEPSALTPVPTEEAAESVQASSEPLSSSSAAEDSAETDADVFSTGRASSYVHGILDGELTTDSVVLDVPEMLQTPELPTGCEATALAIVMQAYGQDIDKTTMASEYLPYSDNLAVGFAGDPFSTNGSGVFPSGLCIAAENYAMKNNLSLAAINTTGTSLEDLYKLVQAGYPVLVWTTMFMSEPTMTDTTYTDGTYTYNWYTDEHCVVLYGYNRSANEIYVSDPLSGLITRDADAFTSIFDAIGQYSMVIVDGNGIAQNPDNIPSGSTRTDDEQLQQEYSVIQDNRNAAQSQNTAGNQTTQNNGGQAQTGGNTETPSTPSQNTTPNTTDNTNTDTNNGGTTPSDTGNGDSTTPGDQTPSDQNQTPSEGGSEDIIDPPIAQ